MALKEMEERRVSSKERREAMAEHGVLMEEPRIAINENMMKNKQEKQEYKLMFMNPSGLDDKGKAYLEYMHDKS
jgi:hypothetical protein